MGISSMFPLSLDARGCAALSIQREMADIISSMLSASSTSNKHKNMKSIQQKFYAVVFYDEYSQWSINI